MDFVQKSNFLLAVFFTEIISEKIVFRYFGKKTTIFIPNSAVLTRAKKWKFGNLVFVQKSNVLLSLFFTEIMSQKIVF